MKTLRTAARDARALWRLALVDGLPEAGRVRGLVDAVLASGRAGRITVLTCFLRLLKRDCRQREAKIESAVPLDPSTRAVIEAGLARRYGRAVEASFEVDPGLIAGVRMTAGSDLYDDSLQARLRALELKGEARA